MEQQSPPHLQDAGGGWVMEAEEDVIGVGGCWRCWRWWRWWRWCQSSSRAMIVQCGSVRQPERRGPASVARTEWGRQWREWGEWREEPIISCKSGEVKSLDLPVRSWQLIKQSQVSLRVKIFLFSSFKYLSGRLSDHDWEILIFLFPLSLRVWNIFRVLFSLETLETVMLIFFTTTHRWLSVRWAGTLIKVAG